MNDYEPDLSPSEREAIAAIRRQLDREFGDPSREAATTALAPLEPSAPPPRESTALTIALALGAGTLLAASMMVLTTYTAPSGAPPAPYASPSPPAESPASPVASIAATPPRTDSMAVPPVGRAGRRHPPQRVTAVERATQTEGVTAAQHITATERVTPPERPMAPERVTLAERSAAPARVTTARGTNAPGAIGVARISPAAERPIPIQAP